MAAPLHLGEQFKLYFIQQGTLGQQDMVDIGQPLIPPFHHGVVFVPQYRGLGAAIFFCDIGYRLPLQQGF